MKELSMEEKAKAYDRALERAKKVNRCEADDREPGTSICEYIFPELKESEDERIRKAIIEHFVGSHSSMYPYKGFTKEQFLAWLEKQGKESDDKVEPKFMAGEWIVFNGLVLFIKEVVQGYYRTVSLDGISNSYDWDIDNVARLWTIQDAKGGDLIYVSTEMKGIQAIFHKFENGIIYFHCYLCGDFTPGGYEPSGDVELVKPLQKTHYQEFFQKMHEAGYSWNPEKRELRETEQKQDVINPSEHINDLGGNGCYLKNATQKPSWSEEDYTMIEAAINLAHEYGKHGLWVWLKSLKQRIGG